MDNSYEQKILEFWDKNSIYEKSKKKNAKGNKFYLMDGPPYANGSIHMGTALNKSLKDIALRLKRLQGYDVFDRAGYDTHGVPIEFQVEKEIGSTGKKDIEKYGVKKFVERCKEFATKHIDVMGDEFKNLGVWMDFENPYLTLSDDYVETIWAAFKEADKKGLLYLGKYPVHVCPRCETAVAYNEIEYGKQRDESIFVKFPLKNKKNTFLIIWTTTPWTLPANTGVMVHPNVDYQEVEVAEGERWIIAKDLVPKIMGVLERGFTTKEEFKGKKMEGWKYENPLAKNMKLKIKKGYEVVLSARYVTTEDGTGLVHCAPGHGKEDYEVGKEYGLDMPSPVGNNGLLTEETGKYSGKKAREVDKEIIADLESEGYLVYKVHYDHDYPLCWRDKSPLLMMSQPQWFLKISDIQKKILKENEKINWVPDWMELRMKAWLEGIGDWPISRQRYWGTPLPIWYDSETGEKVVIGSIEELKKLSGNKNIDVHKPGIDNIEIKTKSGRKLKRVNEVLDVWFDSGVSSWAALKSVKNGFDKYWPADLNIEGKDQIRGWWNSQFILSEIMFGKKPVESISVHGMVLDLGKKKMSKSLGNVVSPKEVISKHSRDMMRYYFAKSSKGEDFGFNENEMKDVTKFFMMLTNTNTFVNQLEHGKGKISIEDKWLLSKYNSLLEEVTKSYNEYKFGEALYKLEEFILRDLSRTYIQIIRERSDEVYSLINEVRLGLLKLLAPVAPFITENIWQDLRERGIVKEESVHLSDWPKSDKKKINSDLEKDFEKVLKFIELGMFERDKVKIGLRWPLGKAIVYSDGKIDEDLLEIVGRQLNIKKIELKKGTGKVEIDTTMTDELEAEGFSRELARNIQSERKKLGLQKVDVVEINLISNKKMLEMLKMNENFLKERVNARKIDFIEGEVTKYKNVFTIKDVQIAVDFRNLKGTSR